MNILLNLDWFHHRRPTSDNTQMASPIDPILCTVEMQSSDYYLRQEETVLSSATEAVRNAAQVEALVCLDS